MRNSYIYAETAFHHEGDLNYLIRLIDSAASTGVKGVKFQGLLDLSDFASSFHPGYAFLKNCILSADHWLIAVSHAHKMGLDVIWMPLDKASVELMGSFDKPPIFQEVHSVSFYDQALLDAMKVAGIPVIISAGGRTLDELYQMQKFFGEQFRVLMTGFQAFPSQLSDVKLLRIPEYKRHFPNLTIGYADHSAWNDPMAVRSNEYAFLLGADLFEKHLSIEPGIERTDWQSAVSAETLKEMVGCLEEMQRLIYSEPAEEIFEMTESEKNYRKRQKVPVAARNIELGEKIEERDLVLKMTADPNCIQQPNGVVGKYTSRHIKKDAPFFSSYFD